MGSQYSALVNSLDLLCMLADKHMNKTNSTQDDISLEFKPLKSNLD